jgi:hypothetical protein
MLKNLVLIQQAKCRKKCKFVGHYQAFTFVWKQ